MPWKRAWTKKVAVPFAHGTSGREEGYYFVLFFFFFSSSLTISRPM